MYFYHHLGRGTGKYVERPDGLPVIYNDKILIQLVQGRIEHQIVDKVRLLTQYISVGLWVSEPSSSAAQKINEALQAAPRAVFDSCHLTLMDNTAKLLNELPLRHVEKANNNGHPFYVTPRGFINLSESKLNVYNNSAVTNDQDAIVLGIDYVIPITKHVTDLANHNK